MQPRYITAEKLTKLEKEIQDWLKDQATTFSDILEMTIRKLTLLDESIKSIPGILNKQRKLMGRSCLEENEFTQQFYDGQTQQLIKGVAELRKLLDSQTSKDPQKDLIEKEKSLCERLIQLNKELNGLTSQIAKSFDVVEGLKQKKRLKLREPFGGWLTTLEHLDNCHLALEREDDPLEVAYIYSYGRLFSKITIGTFLVDLREKVMHLTLSDAFVELLTKINNSGSPLEDDKHYGSLVPVIRTLVNFSTHFPHQFTIKQINILKSVRQGLRQAA